MTSKCNPRYFLILVLFILNLQSSHGAARQSFTTCSTYNYSCGPIRNLGYPFWGSGRPGFCGRPEFQLFCVNQSPAVLIGTTPYKILEVDPTNLTMTLAQQEFAYTNTTCPPIPINTTINETLFSLVDQNDVVNLTLLYECRMGVPKTSDQNIVSSFNCSNNGTSSTALVYYDEGRSDDDHIGEIESDQGCGISVGVPVFLSALERLKSGEETLLDVLNGGFRVGFKMNVTACAACVTSGGSCGSSMLSPADFMCYCPHGAFPYHCSARKSDAKKIGTGVGTGLVGSAITIAALYLFYIRRCKKHHSHTSTTAHRTSRNIPSNIPSTFSNLENGDNYLGVNLFSYDELEEATEHFNPSKKLGDGGFGIVYHGKLGDGREVAIKRLYENNSKRVQQFMNEIEILAHLRHKNLVTLYGCTSHHSRELLLVYEYVSNGTLADHLQGKKHTFPWYTRLSIAVETASALVYLHASDIIHRDVKTNNILLDDNLCVKVADFGLSRLFPLDVTHVSTAPQGTPGYVDPEYHQCYQLTDKSDVYSFGVVLTELISSKPAVDMTRHRHEINLSNFAINKIQKDSLHELVDSSLGFELDRMVKEEVTRVAELAFQCLQHDRDMRPTMEDVLDVLTRILNRNKNGDQYYIGLVQDELVLEIPVDEAFRLKADLSPVSSPASNYTEN